jgi:hypothetical protein
MNPLSSRHRPSVEQPSMTRTFLLALVVLLSGCYRYVPARLGAVPEGTEVRLHVSDDGVRRLESIAGMEGRQMAGLLERWADDIVISVRVPVAEGVVDRGLRNRIVLSPSEVIAIDVRERDRTRTAILTAGITGVVGGALIAAFSGVFGGSRDVDPPPEEDARVPIAILRAPWFD